MCCGCLLGVFERTCVVDAYWAGCRWQLCVLVYCSRDTHNVSGRGRVKVVLRNLENGSGNSGGVNSLIVT